MKTIDTIMMVDDDEATNFLHEIIINDTACCNNLIIVDDAQKALEMLKGDLLPSILFIDINMPRMNGWEFLDLFMGVEKSKQIKIIVFSTSLNPKDKDKANSYSNVQFMCKPLTEEIIKQIINDNFF